MLPNSCRASFTEAELLFFFASTKRCARAFDSQFTVGSTPLDAVGAVGIGAYTNGFSTWWYKGLIDELRIYNTALSAEEIALQFQGVYGSAWLPPFKTKTGATLPLKFALYDAYGNFFSVPTGTIEMNLYKGTTTPSSDGPKTTAPLVSGTPYTATTQIGGVSSSTFPKDSQTGSDYRLRISSDTYIVNWHTNVKPDTTDSYVALFSWSLDGTIYYWWNTYQLKPK